MATQDMVDFHAELLDGCLNRGDKGDDIKISFLRLHGSMSQAERVAVFKKFRQEEDSSSPCPAVLLCTDVAARGLDLPSAVDWVVQYNPPITRADYIHRVGRTARAGAAGSSLLLLLPSEAGFVRLLESESLALAEMGAETVLQKLVRDSEGGERAPATLEEAATRVQLRMEEAVAGDKEMHGRASQAYVSYIRYWRK